MIIKSGTNSFRICRSQLDSVYASVYIEVAESCARCVRCAIVEAILSPTGALIDNLAWRISGFQTELRPPLVPLVNRKHKPVDIAFNPTDYDLGANLVHHKIDVEGREK